MEAMNDEKFKRAKKKVDNLKGFYIHLTVYILVNAFILINIYLETVRSNSEFWTWEHFFVLFAWGIGLFFHAVGVFRLNPFFGKDWEKRQIEKYIREDEENAKRFK